MGRKRLSQDEFCLAISRVFNIGNLVTGESALAEDLGFDSLQILFFVLAIEDMAGSMVPLPEYQPLVTMRDGYELYLTTFASADDRFP